MDYILWIIIIGGLIFFMMRKGGGCCGGHSHDKHSKHSGEKQPDKDGTDNKKNAGCH